MEQQFYQGFAQRTRDLAEKADPFTRRRLRDLAKTYDAKGKASGSVLSPPPRTTPRSTLFAGSGEA